ncbi:MAG: hypothetical protein RL078_1018 [Bacteroidota bacterium]|jgi:hypothetical protein
MKLTEVQIADLILAYHDGTLSTEQAALLNALLAENPDLRFDLEEPISLHPSQQTYSGPSLLKANFENLSSYASEEGHPYEKLAIGNLEGTLTNEEQHLVKQLEQDASYQKVATQIQLTQLQPDLNVTYPRIETLLKDAPIRRIQFKSVVATISASAAAILLTIFLVGRQNEQPGFIQKKPLVQAHLKASKKAINNHTESAPSELLASNINPQTAVHPHIVDLPPRDCIVEEVYPSAQVNPENLVAQNVNQATLANNNNQTSLGLPQANQNTNPIVSEQGNGQVVKSALAKEPVTVKTFLLQKTNERLFGTTTPTTDLRYETMARYASETIGIPVRYDVEEGTNTDKIVFQLGPISIERNRAKK